MDKVAIRIGPFAIHWYAILINIGIILALIFAWRESKRQRLNPDTIFDILLVAMPAGIIGARLYYVAFDLQHYLSYPLEIIRVWHGGLAIHGALIFGGLGAWLYCRRKKINFLQWADILAPGIALAQGIGRWGNFVNQEAYGYITDVPWAFYINGAYRHPTFLYESLWDLALAFILVYVLRKKKKYHGQIIALYALGYSAGRFWIEGLRTDSLMIGPIRAAQLVSIIAIVVSLAYMLYKSRQHQNS